MFFRRRTKNCTKHKHALTSFDTWKLSVDIIGLEFLCFIICRWCNDKANIRSSLCMSCLVMQNMYLNYIRIINHLYWLRCYSLIVGNMWKADSHKHCNFYSMAFWATILWWDVTFWGVHTCMYSANIIAIWRKSIACLFHIRIAKLHNTTA